MFTYNGIRITWLGHDGFLLQGKDTTICIDPFKVHHAVPADCILITHEHFDHLSLEDIRKFLKEDTVVVCPKSCAPALQEMRKLVVVAPGHAVEIHEVHIDAIAAYNTNKYRDPATKTVFHPKADGKLGFVVKIDGVSVYHAGDTDMIPEMEDLRPDIALLPVSGTYVMTAEEAAQAVSSIKPKLAIPMHYSAIVGTDADAHRFKELVGTAAKVEILTPAR
jgi:L-ascorbate metabolism protein UlaG (beta-lactamase superfamily)